MLCSSLAMSFENPIQPNSHQPHSQQKIRTYYNSTSSARQDCKTAVGSCAVVLRGRSDDGRRGDRSRLNLLAPRTANGMYAASNLVVLPVSLTASSLTRARVAIIGVVK